MLILNTDERMRLAHYLSQAGHKERHALLNYLLPTLMSASGDAIKEAVDKWIKSNNVCEEGRNRFFQAFPALESPKTVTTTFTVTLTGPEKCANMQSQTDVRAALLSGIGRWTTAAGHNHSAIDVKVVRNF